MLQQTRINTLGYWLLASCLLLTGCGEYENNVTIGNREQILHWGNHTDPEELDPQITTGTPESRIQYSLFEGLASVDQETLEPQPGAAESWQIDDSGTVYRFTLRDDAYWSNGDPVTAEDFRWSFWRSMQTSLGNPYSYMLLPIKNAANYLSGEISDFNQVGIRVLGAKLLEITLENPTPYFLQLLDHHSYYPVHRATIEQHGEAAERGNLWTRPGNMVSNGPFQLKGWQLFQRVIVEKNPHYWDADNVRLREIHFYPTENITTEERMFRAGQLHYTYEVPVDKIKVYREQANSPLQITPYLGSYYFSLNTKRPPLDNRLVRRALAFAIDRKQVVEQVLKAGQQPGFSITPPGTAGYYPKSDIRFDPDYARQLLAEAGYPNGEGFRSLELVYNTQEEHRKVAVTLQQMWKKHLNITVTLRNEDWKVYLNTRRIGDFDMARGGWIGDYVDPNNFLDLWLSNGGNNNSGWGNPQFDKMLLETAPRAKTPEQRLEILQQAESLLLQEMPFIPIYIYTHKHLVHPAVKGYIPNIMNRPSFKHIYLDDSQIDNSQSAEAP